MSYSSEILADSPLAYYRLNEASGALMADSSGNGRNGTYQVGVGAGASLIDDADPSVTFSGGRGYVASASWMNTPNITVEAWINRTGSVPNAVGIVDRDANATRSWQFRVDTTQKLQLVLWTTTTAAFIVNSTTSITAGTTYHVAFTFDGATAKLYVNGALDGSGTVGGTMKVATDRLTIGDGDQNAAFTGRIDEVALYGTALTAARLLAHRNIGLNAGYTGTLGASLPSLTGDLAGTFADATVTGTVGASLPSLTGALAGTAAPPGSAGTFNGTFGALTGTIGGTYSDTGVLTGTLPTLTGALDGTVLAPDTSVLAGTLPALTGDLEGELESGTAATDVTDYGEARTRDGSGEDRSVYPVVPLPPHLFKEPVRIIATQLPEPILVDGRPQ
jgi:hypothetical protein